jgi:hypothetical protein
MPEIKCKVGQPTVMTPACRFVDLDGYCTRRVIEIGIDHTILDDSPKPADICSGYEG